MTDKPDTNYEVAPTFMVNRCDCGQPDCSCIVLGIVDPVVRELRGGPNDGKLGCLAYFPLEYAQALIDQICDLAAERGFIVLPPAVDPLRPSRPRRRKTPRGSI